MSLSKDLISQFVKATKDTTTVKKESTVYGTVVKYNEKTYVKIDGSDLLTPAETLSSVEEGERVSIMIKDHTATITGNYTAPSASSIKVDGMDADLKANTADIKNLVAKNAEIENLVATKATIEDLQAANAEIGTLKADYAEIENLVADKASIGDLKAVNADIKSLKADKADIAHLEANYATIGSLNAVYADVTRLEADKANIKDLEANYATIESLEANYATINQLESNYATIKQLDAANANITNLQTETANINTALIDKANVSDLAAANAVINDLKAGKADIGDLSAANAKIADLEAGKADISVLEANYATIKQLDAANANITNLQTDTANINKALIDKANVSDLNATNANVTNLQATKANVSDLNATNANVNTLTGDLADITTLVNGNLTSDNIQSMVITGDKFTVEDGFIKNAMIDSVNANKINTGVINTNNVKIQSNDGSMVLQGNLQQFKDKNGKVRIQIGKDATGNFTFVLYDENGTGQLINQNGIQSSNAIADGLIVDSKVADNANIAGSKLDIDSVVTEVNNGTTSIKGTKIYLDDQKQNLNVAFNNMSTTVKGNTNTIQSHTTSINAMNGKVTQLISDTTITKQDGTTTSLKDAYNATVDTVDSHSTKIGSLETNLATANNNISSVSSKQATLEQNLNGFKQTVSQTYATKAEFDNLEIGDDNILPFSSIINRRLTSFSTDKQNFTITGTHTDAYSGIIINPIPYMTSGQKGILQFKLKKNSGTLYNIGCHFDKVFSVTKTSVDGVDRNLLFPGSSSWGIDNTNWHQVIIYFTYKGGTPSSDSPAMCPQPNRALSTTVNVTYKEIKVEIGDKLSVWSPCIKDIQGNIVAVDGKFVNYSTTSQMNSAINQKANEITSTVSETYATKTALNTVDGKFANYSTTSAMNSAINQKANEITSSVSETYATKTSLKATDDKFANYSTTSAMNSAINQKSDSILSTVSNTYTTKADFNNLTIGGTNLLLDSKKEYSNNIYNVASYTPSSPLVEGEQYTVSLCVTPAKGSTKFMVYLSNGYRNNADLYVSGTNKQIITNTFYAHYNDGREPSVDSVNAIVQIYRFPNNGTVTTNSTVHWIKIEKGNKATDWTPAPQDIDSAITTVDNKFNNYSTTSQMNSAINQKANEITSTVSETYATKASLTTVDNKFANYSTTSAMNSAINQKANEITSTVSNTYATKTSLKATDDKFANYSTTSAMNSAINQKADSILSTVSKTYATQTSVTDVSNNLKNNYSTTSAMNSAINQKANEITSTVSNTYATKAALNTVDNKFANYSTTSAMNSAINQKANEITSTVSQTYATKTEFNDLDVGGRNLYTGTKEWAGTWTNKGVYTFLDTYAYNCRVARKTTAWSGIRQEITMETNTDYTLSAWIKGDGSSKINAYYDGSELKKSNFKQAEVLSTEWKRYWFTFNSGTATVNKARFENSVNNTTMDICGLKLEKGNKATDWSPAPEDVDSAISTVDGKFVNYSTTSQMNSAINQKANEITSTVSETYATKTALNTVDGKFANYSTTSQMNSAINQKSDSILSTVSKTYTTKSEFDNLNIGGTNLLCNSTFDYNLDKWWRGTGTSADIVANEGIDGGKCIKFIGNLKSAYYIAQDMYNLKPNTQYTFTGYYKTKDVVKGNTNPYFNFNLSYYQNDKYMGEISMAGDMQTNTNGWVKVTKTFTSRATNDWDSSGFRLFFRDCTGTIWYDHIKIEEGNKATDWSPAPEDVDSAISTVDNKFANYSTTSQMNSAINQKANEITSTVSNTYATKTALNTVDGKFANYSTTSQMNSAINQKSDSILSTVSSTYATKTALTTVDNKFANYSTTSQMNSAINQKGDAILSTVSSTYTTKADFNSLDIGGNNILPFSSIANRSLTSYSADKQNFTITGTHNNDYDGIKFNPATYMTSGQKGILQFKLKKNSGTLTNIGCHFDGVFTVTRALVDGVDRNLVSPGSSSWGIDDTNWHHVIVYFTYKGGTPGDPAMCPQPNRTIGTVVNVTFKDIKLEIGNKPSAWSPCIKDIQGDITAVDNKFANYSTTSQMNSAINQKANEITSTVSNTYATKTALNTVDGKFANYATTSAMNSAINQKGDSILSTVSSTYATKTALNTVDGKFANYSTTSAMNTAINQKANEITSSVSNTYTTKTEFGNLRVGGTNLVKNSKLFGSVISNPGEWAIQNTGNEGYKKLIITSEGASWKEIYIPLYSYINSIKDKITISFDYTESASGLLAVNFAVFNGTTRVKELTNTQVKTLKVIGNPDNGWKRVSYTIDPTSLLNQTNTTQYGVEFKKWPDLTGTIQIKKLQVEIGTIATEWNPAPQDTEGSISSLTTRMNSAESKLTKDSLTTIIGSYYTTSSDVNGLITAKGYATTSQLSQTSNSLTAMFRESGGYNLLYNGNFKRGLDHWTVSGTGWTTSENKYARTGINATVLGALNTTKYITQTVDIIEKSASYVLSAYMYVTSNGSNGTTNPMTHLYTEVYYTDGTKGCPSNKPTVFESWQYIIINITPPSDKYIDRIDVFCYVRDTTKRVYIAGVQLEKGSQPTAYTPNPNEVYDGITQIDKDGIKVKHTSIDSNSYTHMSPTGFYLKNKGTDIFKVDANGLYVKGNGEFTGKVTSTSGSIGGFNISDYNIKGTNVGMGCSSGHDYAFWAGASSGSSAPFRVGHDGSLTATQANITGTITGSTINAGTINGATINSDSFVGDVLAIDGAISAKSLQVQDIDSAKYPATLDGNVDLYVNSSSGNDDNEPDDGVRYKTLQGAIDAIPKFLNNKTVYITMETNSTEDVSMRGIVGGAIRIYMNGKTLYGTLRSYVCAASINIYGGTRSSTEGATGVIHPSVGISFGGRAASVGFEASQYAAIYKVKVFAPDSLPSDVTNTNKVCIASQSGTGSVYCKNIQIVNAAIGFRANNVGAMHVNSSSGVASKYGFQATTGGIITIANNAQAGGKTASTNKSGGGQVLYDANGPKFATGNQSTDGGTAPVAPTTKVLTVKSSYGDTYRSSVYNNWKKDGTVRQGDYGYGDCNGCWFFGSAFAEVKGATIKKVTITITRQSGGSSSAVGLVVKSHGHSSRPSGAPTFRTTAGTLSLAPGKSGTLTITNSTILNEIKSGAVKGFGIQTTYDSSHYAVCSGSVTVKIEYQE